MEELKRNTREGKEKNSETPRLVVMLGARTVNPKGLEHWQFPFFVPNQTNVGTSLPGEVSGGFSRMRAIQSEHERTAKGPRSMRVLVTGGREKSGHSRADEAAKQLISRYGLPETSVVTLRAGSTMGNADAAVEYIKEHGTELQGITDIEVVTNDYHMLRAWIMFSERLLKLTSNKDLEVSSEDKVKIRSILEEGLPGEQGDDWSAERVKKTRDEVMAILSPYFSESGLRVVPLVVEEVLDTAGETDRARAKYAQLLRNNKWVKETLAFEYKGIKDLLDGAYKIVARTP